MKTFNLKRILGMLAVGGGFAYVRKQGGLGNAVESLKKLVTGNSTDKHAAVGSSSNGGSDPAPRSGRSSPSAPVTPRF